jgi:hypothetical protein
MESFLRGFRYGVLVYLVVTAIGHCVAGVGRFVMLRWQVTLVLLAIGLYADIDQSGLAIGISEWIEVVFCLAYCVAWAVFRINKGFGVLAFVVVGGVVATVHALTGSILPHASYTGTGEIVWLTRPE